MERWPLELPKPPEELCRLADRPLPVPNDPPLLGDLGLTRLDVRDDERELTPEGELRLELDDVPGPIWLRRLEDVAPTVGRRLLGVERWLREVPKLPRLLEDPGLIRLRVRAGNEEPVDDPEPCRTPRFALAVPVTEERDPVTAGGEDGRTRLGLEGLVAGEAVRAEVLPAGREVPNVPLDRVPILWRDVRSVVPLLVPTPTLDWFLGANTGPCAGDDVVADAEVAAGDCRRDCDETRGDAGSVRAPPCGVCAAVTAERGRGLDPAVGTRLEVRALAPVSPRTTDPAVGVRVDAVLAGPSVPLLAATAVDGLAGSVPSRRFVAEAAPTPRRCDCSGEVDGFTACSRRVCAPAVPTGRAATARTVPARVLVLDATAAGLESCRR
ncbi:MAG: hypothetical protein F4X77_04315 [Acidobacteriia bacterium]|nr:hypothetical protein [Terriglobia bacterium]